MRLPRAINAPFAGEEEGIVVRPERHQDTARLVDRRLLDIAERAGHGLPERDLAVAHPAGTRRHEAVLVTQCALHAPR